MGGTADVVVEVPPSNPPAAKERKFQVFHHFSHKFYSLNPISGSSRGRRVFPGPLALRRFSGRSSTSRTAWRTFQTRQSGFPGFCRRFRSEHSYRYIFTILADILFQNFSQAEHWWEASLVGPIQYPFGHLDSSTASNTTAFGSGLLILRDWFEIFEDRSLFDPEIGKKDKKWPLPVK